MNSGQIEQIGENAVIVPSFSLQTMAPGYHLFGTIQVLGVVDEPEEPETPVLLTDT